MCAIQKTACHPERSPAEIPLRLRLVLLGQAPKVRQAQDDTFGVLRDAVEIRARRGSNGAKRRLESNKKSVDVTKPFVIRENGYER